MKHATVLIVALLVVSASTAIMSRALDGKDGYGETSLLTPSDVKSDVTYPTGVTYVEKWQDLSLVEFWAPIRGGQRDGLAANASDELFFLVRGMDSTDADDPRYTGLIKYDGTDIEHLIQDEMDSGWIATREGSELEGVITSPCTEGLLEEGFPVILRHVITGQGDDRTFSAEVVMVDPDDGSETDLYIGSFGNWTHEHLAIDSGGTIYVGPLGDGSIAKLTYVDDEYVKTSVPGTFEAGCALIIGPNDDLYTFSIDETFSSSTKAEKDIYCVDPGTGAASVYASVAGWTHPRDWVVGSDGTFWIALFKGGGKSSGYVTDVVESETTTTRNKISDSDTTPWSIAAGPDGKIYVLENPFSSSNGEIWLLTPGSGGGGGGGKPPKKPK